MGHPVKPICNYIIYKKCQDRKKTTKHTFLWSKVEEAHVARAGEEGLPEPLHDEGGGSIGPELQEGRAVPAGLDQPDVPRLGESPAGDGLFDACNRDRVFKPLHMDNV